MFNEIIHLDKKTDITYGTTQKSASATRGDILGLLEKHDIEKYGTIKDGATERIGFTFQDKPYVITIPRVYIKGEFNEMIGPRLVYYYLKLLLDAAKDRVITFDMLMIGARSIEINGETMTLAEAVDRLPEGNLIAAMSAPALPKGED